MTVETTQTKIADMPVVLLLLHVLTTHGNVLTSQESVFHWNLSVTERLTVQMESTKALPVVLMPVLRLDVDLNAMKHLLDPFVLVLLENNSMAPVHVSTSTSVFSQILAVKSASTPRGPSSVSVKRDINSKTRLIVRQLIEQLPI